MSAIFLLGVLVYIVLQCADAITTYIAIESGNATERNRLVAYVMNKLGSFRGLMLIKTVAIMPFFYVTPTLPIVVVLYILIVVYLGVVLNNISVIRQI